PNLERIRLAIEISGDLMEGGGQILRTSVTLAAITGKKVRVKRIRANRPNPGLRRQHITAILAAAALTSSNVKGLQVGSESFEYDPQKLEGGTFRYDVGTAGSVSLVIQTILPIALWAKEPTHVELTGGTDVKWSPPIDYLRFVYFPVLSKFLGAEIVLQLRQRGHYPKGGGNVVLEVFPLENRDYKIELRSSGSPSAISGISHCAKLPPHVAQRQAQSASQYLRNHGLEVGEISIETYPRTADPHWGSGSGITIYSEMQEGAILGGDSIGERGKKAEIVGKQAAMNLLSAIESSAATDRHLGDMLLPFMVLSPHSSIFSVSEVTSHLLTNIEIVKRFSEREFHVKGKLGEKGLVKCLES
ncbi:MAG: RNA 3'-terminal phosphate cyclase, partial [Candidatus Hodarchaeales archaeon]